MQIDLSKNKSQRIMKTYHCEMFLETFEKEFYRRTGSRSVNGSFLLFSLSNLQVSIYFRSIQTKNLFLFGRIALISLTQTIFNIVS